VVEKVGGVVSPFQISIRQGEYVAFGSIRRNSGSFSTTS